MLHVVEHLAKHGVLTHTSIITNALLNALDIVRRCSNVSMEPCDEIPTIPLTDLFRRVGELGADLL